MSLKKNLKTLSIAVLFAYILCFVPTSPVFAAWVGTPEAMGASKAQLLSVVERQDVQAMIASMGVEPAEAARRVSAMTESEARAALDKLGQMPAGGDGFGSLVGACVFIFVLLLITDILGLTHVFPFTNRAR